MAFKWVTLSAALLALVASDSSLMTGFTTRYWDCCKVSCSWPGKTALAKGPVTSCSVDDKPLADPNQQSGCGGGPSYACSTQQPFEVNATLSYGFAAVNIVGQTEKDWCCSCYHLTFTNTNVTGQQMIVQATNTGGDLLNNQFDLQMPGGGVGLFNGCTKNWNAPADGWGKRYGGLSGAPCTELPKPLQPGCNWMYGWFKNAPNPKMTFKRVKCPAEITAKSGCIRADESTVPAA